MNPDLPHSLGVRGGPPAGRWPDHGHHGRRHERGAAWTVGFAGASRLPWPELWLPWLLGAAALALVGAAGLDFRWADWLYAVQGQRWALKSAFVTETVLHTFGRELSTLAWLGVVVAWALSLRTPQWRDRRRPLGVLALSVLLATGGVALLKSGTHVDCPWDLVRYGGRNPFVPLWAARPEALGSGGCFPAGHASGGYAWMALYFYFRQTRPALRWHGLAIGLVTGLVFGLAQQVRGAHFLSHDLWAALLCWTVAVLAWRLLGRREGSA